MARTDRRMLADMRALEEESERMNPINPKKVLGSRKGYTGLIRDSLSGSGATPSMGLSTVRGGGLLGPGGVQRVVGAGTKKGQMRKTSRKAYEDIGRREVALHKAQHRALEEEGGALSGGALGKELGERMLAKHGAGFFDDFKKGFMSVISPIASIAKPLLPMAGPYGAAASAALGALGAGKMRGCGKVEEAAKEIFHEVYSGREMDAALRDEIRARHSLTKKEIEAAGAKAKKMMAEARAEMEEKHGKEPVAEAEDTLATARKLLKMKRGKGMSGGLRTGAYEGKGKKAESESDSESGEEMEGGGFISDLGIPLISDAARVVGLGKKKRAAAGPSDKRRKRGELVSKLMKEKGMSLAEASKHIKEHGLL